MKKMLTFCAMIAGAFTLMVGTTSCKDDEKCCEWTDEDGMDYKACEDDAIVQSVVGWEYILTEAAYYGGTCD